MGQGRGPKRGWKRSRGRVSGGWMNDGVEKGKGEAVGKTSTSASNCKAMNKYVSSQR